MFQSIFWLNALAWRNMELMYSTCDVSQPLSGWLNSLVCRGRHTLLANLLVKRALPGSLGVIGYAPV